jgi:hypothetical protein
MDGQLAVPITRETGMNVHDSVSSEPRRGPSGRWKLDLASRIEGDIERRACGRIRDLHVVCSDDSILLQGRTRTYHAKQLAQQAVLEMTDGYPLLTNQIVVC